MQPYMYFSVGPATDNSHKFTGKERDPESGLDNLPARYYGSNMGRFMSPDPSGLYMADPENPQTRNLYSYAGNIPICNTDPSGLSKDCGAGGDPSVVCIVTSAWDWLKDHWWLEPAPKPLLIFEQSRLGALSTGRKVARHRLVPHLKWIGFLWPARRKKPCLRVRAIELGVVR